MAARLIELRQPEGGAEHALVYVTHHRCPQARALVGELGSEVDLLIFPVGNVGYGMPLDIPFPVTAAMECDACGRTLTANFVWRRGRTNYGGSLWTIDDGAYAE